MTPQRLRFVQEYAVDLNGAAAVIRAGYAASDANNQAYRLLRDVEVQAAVAAELAIKRKRNQITQDRVLQELARIAFFDPRKLFYADGSPKGIHELDDDTAAAIAGMDVSDIFEGTGPSRRFVGQLKKYKLADKMAALTTAMRHLGMLNDKLVVQGDPDNPVEVRQVAMTLAEQVASIQFRKVLE